MFQLLHLMCRSNLRVAIVEIPHHGPYHAQCSQQIEGRAPSHPHHHRYHHKGRQGASHARCSPHVALCLAHFAFLKPSADNTRRARRRSCLTDAEHKADDQQRSQSSSQAREGRECRPPQHDGSQYLPVSEPIAQRTHRNLHQSIAQDECTLHPSPLRRTQVQVVHDARPCHADIDSVQECHHAQNHEHGQNHILIFHCSLFTVHYSLLQS